MKSFFQNTLDDLGISESLNSFQSPYKDGRPLAEGEQPVIYNIFEEDQDGNILINYYTIQGTPRMYRGGSSRWPKAYKVKRLKAPVVDKNGDTRKYDIPKGAKAFPFHTPGIIRKFNAKEKITTLVLTEGVKKAMKGYAHRLDIIAPTSITTLRDKETQTLHPDILDVIDTCQVENIIWLTDGDCLRLSGKWPEKPEVDLYLRPSVFYNSARNIKVLLQDRKHLNIFFAHILSDDIETRPKGLDDLYIWKINSVQKKSAQQAAEEITEDLINISRPCVYFKRIDITNSLKKLADYFHLTSAEEFYTHYQPDIGDKAFVFNGTKYQWDEENKQVKVLIPGAAKFYVRVGDQYYKWVNVPNKYNQIEKRLDKRLKSTLLDDHGKNFTEHVQKFDSFCNVPDHENYQDIIRNCLNRYHAFEHQPADVAGIDEAQESCGNTLEFISHIFGKDEIRWKKDESGQWIYINEINLGLDYIQLLFQKPTQILPILCLVSKENMTGKTTFSTWLKLIFTQNMAVVGNSDLANDFNASWASKLVICCDESKIDKQIVVERIKSLSTADKILMNQKGKDHVEIDFFGKFILLTNHEENFIYAGEEDIRYWVRKIPQISKDRLNVDLMADLEAEIPYFLAYLQRRKMATENCSRMWFDPQLIRTDALRRVIEYSRPVIEKEMRMKLKELFLDFGYRQITMTTSDIDREFFNRRYRHDQGYLSRVIRDNLNIQKKRNGQGKEEVCVYEYPKIDGNGEEFKMLTVKSRGRPWLFEREKFVTPEEDALVELDAQSLFETQIVLNGDAAKVKPEDKPPF